MKANLLNVRIHGGHLSARFGPKWWPPLAPDAGEVLSELMGKPPPGKTANLVNSGSTAPDAAANSSPETPVRTDPLPEAQRGAWFDGDDIVTALREYDTAVEYQLPRDTPRFLIGGSRQKCDIALPGRGLSAVHGLLERRGAWMRLVDQHSTNGLYFQDRKVGEVSIAPGAVFTLAPVTFIAMNDEMRRHRPAIVDIIGTGFTPSPDRFLIDVAMGSSNLLLTGEPHCDQDELARVVHAVSLRRSQTPVELPEVPDDRLRQRAIIDSAARSTLVLSIKDDQRSIDPTFCSMLFSPGYHVRVIVLASTADVARAVLSRDAVDQMQHVWVRPLALRTHDIDRLLDRELARRNADVRAADLTPGNLAALRGYHWPDNLARLRLLADEIVAHRSHDGLRPAARSLGVSKTTLQKHFERAGLSLPLFTG
jgi:hypothetical protein